MDDPRVTIIARRFCQHGQFGAPKPGCTTCHAKAQAAVQEIGGQGELLPMEFGGPASGSVTIVSLSDPGVNTPGKERAGSSDTTNAARWAVMPRTGSQRHRILEAFVSDHNALYGRAHPEGGWTDDELIVTLRMTHQSVGPRRGELVAGGWLEDSGLRRPTRAGLDAIVWTLTPAGRERLALEQKETA